MTKPKSSQVPGSNQLKRQRGKARTGWIALIVVVLLAVAAGAWWWKQKQGAEGAPMFGASGAASGAAGGASGPGGARARRFGAASQTLPVSAQAVRRQDIRVLVTAIGNIAATNTAVVRTKVDGELKAIRFKEGQQVRAGQLLAEIDPRTYEVALAQAQGQMARDQAQLRNAQLDLDRYKGLLAQDSIAKQQVDTQEALVRQLQGTVQSDQASVDAAKLQLSYTKVVAPISGRLGLKQADLGNVVHASDVNGIVSITQVQPISVVFAVAETNLPVINRRLKAGDPMPVEAWDREQRNRLATGKVASTDNAIDPVTGTIKLKAEFPNADGTLFPNQFVNIRLQVDTLTDVLVVPVSAVQRGAQGTYVYMIREDGTATVKRIRMGSTEGDWVSVEADLKPGDRVVTDGADRLREGAKVEVIVPSTRIPEPGQGGGRRRGQGGAGGPAGGPAGGASAPAGGASAPQTAQAAPSAEGGEERPRWMDRLPPDVVEKIKAMSPEERRAYLQKLRERRQQSQGN